MNPKQINRESELPPAQEITTPTISQPVISNEQPKKNSQWKRIVILIA